MVELKQKKKKNQHLHCSESPDKSSKSDFFLQKKSNFAYSPSGLKTGLL